MISDRSNPIGAVVALQVDGVVVVRHGTLVYERYFRGYNADEVHIIQSVTKSVVALWVGIAVDHGWLRGVAEPVLSYFPGDSDLRSQNKDRITVRDLLTMTSDLEWPEWALPYSDPSNIVPRMDRASDPYRFVLAQPSLETRGIIAAASGAHDPARLRLGRVQWPLDEDWRPAL